MYVSFLIPRLSLLFLSLSGQMHQDQGHTEQRAQSSHLECLPLDSLSPVLSQPLPFPDSVLNLEPLSLNKFKLPFPLLVAQYHRVPR